MSGLGVLRFAQDDGKDTTGARTAAKTRASARANAGVSPLRFAPVEMTFFLKGGFDGDEC